MGEWNHNINGTIGLATPSAKELVVIGYINIALRGEESRTGSEAVGTNLMIIK